MSLLSTISGDSVPEVASVREARAAKGFFLSDVALSRVQVLDHRLSTRSPDFILISFWQRRPETAARQANMGIMNLCG